MPKNLQKTSGIVASLEMVAANYYEPHCRQLYINY